MAETSLPIRPTLQLLSNEQIEEIHLASLKILEEVGVGIQSDVVLRMLAQAGAEVHNGKNARIPPHLVKEALGKAPSTIRLFSRDGKNDLLLEGNRFTIAQVQQHTTSLIHRPATCVDLSQET